MRNLMYLLIFLPIVSIAQGIKFEEGLSWEQIKAKAKLENKFIFLDCYATWCGPCKFMAENIYPRKEVGDFFNIHFINVEIQMDKTPYDSRYIRDWYSDAISLSKQYWVDVYPTYLFFSPDGIAVHRESGATGKESKDFIRIAEDALDSGKQYYTTLSLRQSRSGDSVLLLQSLTAALAANDKITAVETGGHYFDIIKDTFSKNNIRFGYELMQSSRDRYFRLFMYNSSKIDELMNDENFAESKLSRVIYGEELASRFEKDDAPINWYGVSTQLGAKYPMIRVKLIKNLESKFKTIIIRRIRLQIYETGALTANWKNISAELKKKYPGYDYSQILLEEKAKYYEYKKLWSECEQAAFILLDRYGSSLDDREINNIAWYYIFLHSNNKKILVEAAKWVKHSIDTISDRENDMDTYANLLYKMGDRKNAILWEKRAIAEGLKNNARAEDMDEFKENLRKMDKKEKTWEDNSVVL